MKKFCLPLGLCVLPAMLFAQGSERGHASQELQVAVEEFRRLTSQDATAISEGSVRTSRGSNAGGGWHGRLYENFRNDFLDAVPHEVVQNNGEKGLLRRNQFGFNVSGPVLIPKVYDGAGATFFSFSFEGMRESIGRSQLGTVATMAERTGDFSQVVDSSGRPLIIYDPTTTSLNPNYDPTQPISQSNLQYNRMPFPGNQIEPGLLDPVAQQALSYYPEPNTAIGPYFQNNYFVFSPETNRADGFIASVDHSFMDRHRLDFQLNYSNGVASAAGWYPTIADPGTAPRDRNSRAYTLEHVFTASPTNINTLRLRADIDRNINQAQLDADGNPFPRYRFRPYVFMGRSYPLSGNVRNVFSIEDTFSTRWKAHRFTISGEVVRTQINIFSLRYPSGSFEFSDGLTSLPGIVNTGHAFASFLLGGAAEAEQNLSFGPSYFRNWEIEINTQDRWEVRPGLTLTLGANWSIRTPRTEKYNRQSNISFSESNPENGLPGALVVAGENGYGRAFEPTMVKVEPTAGLAWNVLGLSSSVLRLNYARRYPVPGLPFGQFATQAFNGNPSWVSANEQLSPAVVLADGLPTDQSFPDLSLTAANGTNADVIDTSGRQPAINHFGVAFEQELPGSLIISVEGIRSNGRDMYLSNNSVNGNAIPLEALAFRDLLNDEEFRSSLRPYPQYQRFNHYSYPGGRFERKSMEVRVDKRTSSGLSLSASYEYSREKNNFAGGISGSRINFNGGRGGRGGGGGGGGGGGRQGIQDYYNLANEWALSAGNRPHELTLTYMYELPFGPNQMFLNSAGWTRHLVADWSISGVSTFRSGTPLRLDAEFNNTGGVVDSLRPNVVPGVDPHVADPGPELWFNPAAFSHPEDFTVGNVPRTHPTLRNPGMQNHDLSMNKRFPTFGDNTLEFSASMFNFINHANWNQPDTEIGTAESPNTNAGRIIGSRGGRVVQLSLRFNF